MLGSKSIIDLSEVMMLAILTTIETILSQRDDARLNSLANEGWSRIGMEYLEKLVDQKNKLYKQDERNLLFSHLRTE